MIWAARQLFAPLRYLAISQGNGIFTSKFTYDIIIPAMISIFFGSMSWIFNLPLGFLSTEGFVADILDLLNLLTAFFIAALAAVATFDRPGLDTAMKGDPATLNRRNRYGENVETTLTHRQFICYLFGFLSHTSILLLITLYFFRAFSNEAIYLINNYSWINEFAKPILICIFFFVIGHIFVTMLLGIYFLCDRLQVLDNNSI